MPSAPPIARPVVFPLYGVSDGKCACGNPACGAAGKHPRVSYRELKYGDEVPFPRPGEGAGMKCGAEPYGSGVFVVDLDGPDAAIAFDAMGETPETYTVTTPREGGGWHLYFKYPGFHVKTSSNDLAKGIDIRGDGGIVIAPGSPHRNGGTYNGDDTTPIADAPPWLLEWLKQQRVPTTSQIYPGDVEPGTPEHGRRRGLYAEYLRTEAVPRGPERRGQGDAILFDVVQRGAYDLRLPVEDVLELVAEHYDPRCDPQWGDELEERVHHKARCAKEESQRGRMEPLPADLVHLAGAVDEPVDFANIKTTPAPAPNTNITTLGERWGGWGALQMPPVYLLDGLIPEGKVITFFAEGGSVKTWSALALAIAVATGKPWLEEYPVKKGKVLFLDYEDGPFEVGRRVRMLTGGADIPDLGYLYGGPQIDKTDLWKTLAHMVSEQGITFVVVDSLGAGMPGDADENTTAFAEGMKIAGRFTETGCTVLFVHHANKTGGMRGTSAARDQSDVVFKFEAVSETDTVKRMRMVCDKPGPQKRPPPVNVELTDTGLRTFKDEGGDAIRNADKPDDLRSAIKLALMSGPRLITDLRNQFGGKTQAVADAIKALTEAGEVVCLDRREGIRLDDAQARRTRLLRTALTYMGSKAGLALKAKVLLQDIDAAIDAKDITTSGSGFVVNGNL